MQPFLPEFGVTAGCNSLAVGTFLRPQPACELLADIAGTIVAGVSADIHPDAPVPRRFPRES